MAIHAHSTTAPARPLLPLFFRPSAPFADCRSADGLLAEIAVEIDRQEAEGGVPKNGDILRPEFHDHVAKPELPPEPLLSLGLARSIHDRRQLEAAADHGAAMLDALVLPPVALDALDAAIAALDALDGDTEAEDDGTAEPTLGAPENHPARWYIDMACRYHVGRRHHPLGDQTLWAAGQDAEADSDGNEPEEGYDLPEGDDERDGSGTVSGHDDEEYSLGWNETVSQLSLGTSTADGDATALERHGKGFVRSGHEDAEDDELGEEHTGVPIVWVFGPQRAEGAHV